MCLVLVNFWLVELILVTAVVIVVIITIIETQQQNVLPVTKISEGIFFIAKNTALVTKYEFYH